VIRNVAIIGAGIGAEHLAGYRALRDKFRVVAMCECHGRRDGRLKGSCVSGVPIPLWPRGRAVGCVKGGGADGEAVTLGAANDTTRLRFCFAGLTAESGTAPYTPAQDAWTFTARGETPQSKVDEIVAGVTVPKSGFAGFLETVAAALDGREARAVSFADGQQSIALVTALYTSAREGRPVKLPITKGAKLYHGWQPD